MKLASATMLQAQRKGVVSPAQSMFAAALLWAAGAPLPAQDTLGPGPGRVLSLRQVSWWAADGLPAGEVVARETTFVFRPDSERGWPAFGTVPVGFDLEPGPFLDFSIIVVPRTGIREVLLSAEEARCGDEYADSPGSALATIAFALVTPAHGEAERSRALPMLSFAACGDTVRTEWTRSIMPFRPDSGPGRGAVLSLRGTIIAVARIERHLASSGTTVRSRLTGTLSGRARLGPEGVPDRFELSGGLRGLLVFENPWGTRDSVYGTWGVQLSGIWQEDPRHRSERLFEYFAQHGRYPEGESGSDRRKDPYERLVDRARSDSSAIDSLVAIRVQATEPSVRADVEDALGRVDTEQPGLLARRLLATETRIAPRTALHLVRYGSHERKAPFGVAEAKLLTRELAPLAVQRRRLTDREDLGAAVVSVLGTGVGFVPDAGPILEAAARRADDPLSRDLLWFAAYQADPARYRSLVQASVDSLRGYGPIARAWMSAEADLTPWSWGVEPDQLDSLSTFPGVDASAQSLREYLSGSAGHHTLAPLRMRFRAEGRDLGAEMRRRFGRDTTFAVRAVLARYLEQVDDTTARRWLRGLLHGPDSARALAYGLLPPDSVTDTTLVAQVQRLLIGYIAGRVALLDTAGQEVKEPWVHDERPDQRILASDGVMRSAFEPWQRHYQLMSLDSVRARVPSEGLQMAWVLSPLEQLGDRFFASISLRPVGQMCLCGGGVGFVLERRQGQWVVVSASHWIS